MDDLKKLLKDIEILNHKNLELKRKTAEGFNIFSTLLKPSDEVNLHSKFIYELLNPKGSHQQGSLFLNLFFKEIEFTPSKYEKFSIFREKDNIDILIQSSRHSLIIENKIYTKDHSSQLSRYIKIIEQEGYSKSDISLIYLTLFGEKPLEEELNIEVKTLSYAKHIVDWIESSIIESENIPILKETLKQYLTLIEDLTNQSKKREIFETKDFLLQDNHLQMVIGLEPSIIEAKIEIQLNFWKKLLSNLIPHYPFTFYNINIDKGLEDSVRRYYQLQKNSKDYGIKYQVDDNLIFFVELRKNIYYGFEFIDEDKIDKSQIDSIELLDILWKEVCCGIYWKYPAKPLDFKSFNHQNIFDLINPEQQSKDIGKITNEIIHLISQYKQYKKESICLKS